MSIYTALNFDPPVIAYCALHQVRKGTKKEDYMKTMEDLHRLIKEHSDAVNAAWEKYHAEASTHILQRQQSLLSEFLSTPLKSDSEAIQQILASQLNEYARRILPKHRIGLIATNEGRISTAAESSPRVKKLLGSGRKYLSELGFKVGKGHSDSFESVFLFEGGQNFDVIEHLVRDRVGIYTPVHGKHIKEFDSYAYAAYNLVYLSGTLTSGGVHEASLFFSKGATHYSPFRNALKEILDKVQESSAFPHISVWQRKLGLGAGREFVLRIRGDDMKQIARFFGDIPVVERKEFASKSLQAGHLLMKEMVIG